MFYLSWIVLSDLSYLNQAQCENTLHFSLLSRALTLARAQKSMYGNHEGIVASRKEAWRTLISESGRTRRLCLKTWAII